MIVFELACGCGELFEGWFEDRADFERQAGTGLLICPTCGSPEVHKVLSPVRSLKGGKGGERSAQVAVAASPEEAAGQALKALQEYVLRNYEDVGSELARECLKVRYGLNKARNIRGVATEVEEEMLNEEGIELLKIPLPAKPEGDA